MDFSVIFDMDGVIIDSAPYHFKAWKRFARKYALVFDEAEFKNKLFGRTNHFIMEGLFGRKLPEDRIAALAEEKESLYRRLYSGHVRPAQGLERLLDGLRAAGVTTAVATAAPRANLTFALEETHLGPRFDVLVDLEMVSKGKPAPDLYLKAAELLKRRPEACVAVEDSYPGIASALAAGMKVVGVTTTHTAEELSGARIVVGDFRKISPADFERLARS